jgi:hypothetical protein
MLKREIKKYILQEYNVNVLIHTKILFGLTYSYFHFTQLKLDF